MTRKAQFKKDCLASRDALDDAQGADLFRFIYDHIADEVLLTDSLGRIVYVNQATVNGLKYTRQELLNKYIYELFKAPLDFSLWKMKYFNELKRTGKPMNYSIGRIIKGGEHQIIEAHATYVCHKGREYVLSIARDITRQVQLQNKLRASQHLYQLATEGARDGILTADFKCRIIYANKSFVQLVGYPADSIQGLSFKKFVARSSLPRVNDFLEQVRRGFPQIRDDIEFENKNRDHIPVEINATPLYEKGQVLRMHMIVRDIRLQKRIKQMYLETEKSNALRSFIAHTTRELQTPIQAIVQLINGLLRKYEKRQFEYIGYREFKDIIMTLKVMSRKLTVCSEKTERILTMNRKKMGLKDAQTDVRKIILAILKKMEVELEAQNIQTRINIPQSTPFLTLRAIEFSQICENIIQNSVQAMPQGGILSISASYDRHDKFVNVEFKDNGVGIPRENLKTISDPVSLAGKIDPYQNTGFGLSVVHALIKSCHGQIKIQSSLRRGTSVSLFLPAMRGRRLKAAG